jgi:Calx-beta domain
MLVLSSPKFTVVEGHFLRFSIIREGDDSLLEKVAVCTLPRCARPGTDYEHLEKIIEFPPGTRQVDLSIKIYQDNRPEFDEFFEIRLFQCTQNSPLPCGELGEPNMAIAKIIDADT